MPAQTGITSKTTKRLVLDAGAVYRNHGETVGMALVGATRGGATFTVEQEIRDIEVDGTKGPIKGMRRLTRHTAKLEFTLIEISKDTLLELTRGTATPKDVAASTGVVGVPTATGTHQLIVPDNTIVDADYLKNLALVGDVMNTAVPCIIKILNALPEGEWSLTTDDANEGELGVTYSANYDPAAMDTPPYQILWPTSSDT